MGQRKSLRWEAVVVTAIITAAAAVFLAGIPSCSADVTKTTSSSTMPMKPRNWPWRVSSSPRSPSPVATRSVTGEHQSSYSSVVLPLYGNVYPHGIYYVSINIGDPPKPYFLDVDTGSDVTWLQCDAPCVSCSQGPHPLYRPANQRLVPCENPLCAAVHESTNHEGGCEVPHQCDYEIQYQDQGSSIGVLVADAFALRLTNSSLARPALTFGCGYDQQGGHSAGRSATDGVLGLGNGKVSILSQLRDLGVCRSVIGHCLSRQRAGFLFFGDDVVPSRGVTWAPMSRVEAHKYYSPGLTGVYAGKQQLAARQALVLDSGSSYTYFTDQLYQSLLSVIISDITKTTLKEAPEEKALPLCWKGTRPFKSVLELRKYFRSLILAFGNGKAPAVMQIPPENYFIVTKQGNACLGILNGTEVGLDHLNVIGDISMQDVMVVYDNERQKIGWTPLSGCDRIPNADEGEDGLQLHGGLLYQLQFSSMGALPLCPAQ